MRKVELLPTLDCEAGYSPGHNSMTARSVMGEHMQGAWWHKGKSLRGENVEVRRQIQGPPKLMLHFLAKRSMYHKP